VIAVDGHDVAARRDGQAELTVQRTACRYGLACAVVAEAEHRVGDEALAASANIPLPAIRPAVEVTIAAMAAAYRRTGFMSLRSLSVENVSTLSTGRERAEFGGGTRKLTAGS
jgi:hypothetical protein